MKRFFVFASLLFALPVLSQTTEKDSLKKIVKPEVIVTGFPEEELVTPIPFSELHKEEISKTADFKDVPSIVAETPSVLLYSQSGLNMGYSFANIRGFDQRRMSILVNGIPQNDPEDHNVYWIDMPDLASNTSKISVQRGAGSAFYGPPAIGGSMNVVTMPSATREISLGASYGSFGTQKFNVNINSGLIEDKYAISARLSQFKTEGYRNHANIDLRSYYLSIARYDTNFTMQLNFYGGPVTDGLDYYGIYPDDSTKSNLKDKEKRKINWSESFTYERRPEETEQFSQPHYELLTTWSLEPNVKFYNSLFYVQGEGQFDFDGTWVRPSTTGYSASYYYQLTPEYGNKYGFSGINDTALGNELTRGFVGSKQFGWLPRIEWQHEDGTLNIGAEVRIHRSLHWGKLLSASIMPADLPGDYHFYEYKGGKDIFSFYASELYKATDKLNFSLSAQLLHQTYRFYDQKPFYIDSSFAAANGLVPGFTSYQFTIPLTFLNPRFGINYLISDNLNIYGSVSYTSREARLKDYYNAEFFSEPNFAKTQFGTYDFGSPNVKPESLMDIEIGNNLTDAISPDVLWKQNVVFYYMPFKDELTSTGAVDRFGSSIVGNADNVLHFGLELAERFEFQNTLVLEGNITWSHNEIKKFSSYTNPDAVVGKVPIGFPSLLAGLSADYHLSKAITIGLTGRYVGTMYGDIENTDLYKNDPYFVMDGNLSIRQENVAGLSFVELKIQANNILNEYYTSYVESGSGFFVAAPFNIFGGIQIGL